MDAEALFCVEMSPFMRDYILHERRFHVNEMYKRREERGEYHLLFPELLEDPEKFHEYFRMKKETFYYILEGIRDKIVKYSNFRKCITPEERLMVTLRFLSTGLAFRSLAFNFRMGFNTIAKIVAETCKAIWEAFHGRHMPVPSMDALKKISMEYEQLWSFPNCVGSIDGKHIRIKCPSKSGSWYHNYKKFFSVHLQGIADARCKFVTVDIGDYGRRGDSAVFERTNVYRRLQNKTFNMPPDREVGGATLPYVLLGDQGYPLKDYLLRPYPTTEPANPDELEFNFRLSRARRSIECAFGILVSKWRCLKTELQVNVQVVDVIVQSVCILHNIIIDRENAGTSHSLLAEAVAHVEEVREEYVNRNRARCRRYNRASQSAYEIRDKFKAHFVNR